MPRASGPTLARILDAGFRLFFRRGFARVSMDDIAAAAGVTKRTLYYHFDSKDALVGAVLDAQAEQSLAVMRAWVDPEAATPAAFAESLFGRLAHWMETPGWTGSGYTRLVMELADLPGHPAREVARRHKAAVEAWVATELAARGARAPGDAAATIALLIEGSAALRLIHGDARHADAARAAALSAVS